MSAPRASFRIQLRAHGVDFAAVERELDGLARLGISHLYLSPVLEARRGSSHGYDGTDPRHVDPALGGIEGLRALADAAAARGLGLLVDLVPNHLAASPQNPLFADLLARGPASRWAEVFDVDWEAAGGRIVLPWLPAPLARCIEEGELRVEGRRGRARLRCGELSLPLAEGTLAATDDAGPRGIEALLARQFYALEHWRRARRRLNYRRFFDVDELIGVRAERPAVFELLHGEVLTLVREGRIDGLRIDHVDGIADPAGYLRRLRRALDAAAPGRRPWLVVEKILERGEAVPRGWPVDGTTGYEFLNDADALWLAPAGVDAIEADWARRVRARGGFEAAARSGRRRALDDLLVADLRRVARRLAALPQTRGVGAAGLARALRAWLVRMDVYRVYPAAGGRLAPAERARVADALGAAAQEGRAPGQALAALRRVLLPRGRAGAATVAAARAVQQLAAATAAKGVEDTAFYAWTPLLCRNEVGGDPGRGLDRAIADFHAANRARRRRSPHGLLAVSTHDTKRSADVRARLAVLSEVPELWIAAQQRWLRWNARAARALRARARDPRAELMLYQTLVGVWPLRRRPLSERARRQLAERVEAHLVKSTREAKRDTSWVDPEPRFEAALAALARSLLLPPEGGGSRFLRDLEAVVREVARPGLWNALSRCALQLGAPGVPDLYRGDGFWRFEGVDPDNRRPVDGAARERRLAEIGRAFRSPQRERSLREWVARPEDGRVKLHVLARGLAARREAPELFCGGRYLPLAVRGERARHAVAFLRSEGGRVALVAVPRWLRGLVDAPDEAPVGARVWGDTHVEMPRSLRGRELRSVLSGETQRLEATLPLARLFDPLPVALWLG